MLHAKEITDKLRPLSPLVRVRLNLYQTNVCTEWIINTSNTLLFCMQLRYLSDCVENLFLQVTTCILKHPLHVALMTRRGSRVGLYNLLLSPMGGA